MTHTTEEICKTPAGFEWGTLWSQAKLRSLHICSGRSACQGPPLDPSTGLPPSRPPTSRASPRSRTTSSTWCCYRSSLSGVLLAAHLCNNCQPCRGALGKEGVRAARGWRWWWSGADKKEGSQERREPQGNAGGRGRQVAGKWKRWRVRVRACVRLSMRLCLCARRSVSMRPERAGVGTESPDPPRWRSSRERRPLRLRVGRGIRVEGEGVCVRGEQGKGPAPFALTPARSLFPPPPLIRIPCLCSFPLLAQDTRGTPDLVTSLSTAGCFWQSCLQRRPPPVHEGHWRRGSHSA